MAQSLPFKNERAGRTLTEESSFTGGMHYSDTALDAPYLKSVVNMDYDTVTTNLKTRKPFVPVNVVSEDIANLEFLGALEVPVQNYTIKYNKTQWVSDDTNTVYLFGKRYSNEEPNKFIGASLNTDTVVTDKTLGRTHIQLYDVHYLFALMVDKEGNTHECTLTAYGLVDGSVFPKITTPPTEQDFILKYGDDAPMLTVYGKYVIAPTVNYVTSEEHTWCFRTQHASNTPSLTAFQFYALRDEADMHTTQVLYSYTHFSQDAQAEDTDVFDIEDTLDIGAMSALDVRKYHIAPTCPTDADYTALNTLMTNALAKDHWEGFNLLKTTTAHTRGCSFNSKGNEVHVPNSAIMTGEVWCNANEFVTVNPVQGTDFEFTIGPDAFLMKVSIGRISVTVGTPKTGDREQCYRFVARYDTEDIGECTIDAEQIKHWGVRDFRYNLMSDTTLPFAKILGAFWKFEFRDNTMRVWFRHKGNSTAGDYTLYWTDLSTKTKTKRLAIPTDSLIDINGSSCQVHVWFEDEAYYRTYSSWYRRSSTCLLKEFEMFRPLLYNLIPHTDTYAYPEAIKNTVVKQNVIKTLDDYHEYHSNLRLEWGADIEDTTAYLREIDTAVRYYSIIFKRLEAYGDPEGLRYLLPAIVPEGWTVAPKLKDAYAYFNFPAGSWTNLSVDTMTYSMHVDYNSTDVGALKFTYGHQDANDSTIAYKDYVFIDDAGFCSVSCNKSVHSLFGVRLSSISPYKLKNAFTNAVARLSLHTTSTADVFKELRSTSITTAKNNAYNLIAGNDMYSFECAADLSAGLAPVLQGVYMLDPDEHKVVVTPKIGQYVRLMPVIKLPSNYAEMSTSVRVTWQYTTANTVDSDTVWNTLTCFGNSTADIEQNGGAHLVTIRDLGAALIENPETYDNRLHPLFMVTDETVLVRCTLELYYVCSKVVGTYERPSTGTSTVQEVIVDYTCDVIGSSIANLTIEPAAYRVLAKAPANLATAQGSTVWNNQLFLWGVYANDNTLFWSAVDNPCYFPYPINSHEFDAPIRSLIPYKTGLIAFTADACYRLDSAEKGFTVTCIQRGLDIAVEDAKFIKFIKNMVLFKSGPYFYMVVPKATTYYTGELAIAPIYKTVQKFFDEPNTTITSVLCDMYPEQSEYITQLTTEAPWKLLDSHIEQDVAVLRYGVEATDGLYFSLRYDTTSRQWTAYFDVVSQGTAYVHAYELGNAQKYVVYRNSTAGTSGLKSLYTYTYSIEGVEDTSYPHALPERHFIDTGYRKLTESLKKRFRELQFRMYTPEDTELKFRTKFYVDGMARRDYDKYSGELVEDGIGGKTYILTHNYLDFNMFATDTINPNAEGLEGWALDFSKFATDAPLKIRMACSGKGYLPRLTILSTTGTPFELSGINWVYRTMHGR